MSWIQQQEEYDYNRGDEELKAILRQEAFDPELYYCEAHDTCVVTGCPACIEELQAWHAANPPAPIDPADEPPF